MLEIFSDKKNKEKHIRRGLEILMVLVLALYPLRHIHRGLDLWDVGYNYANFRYMGTESMDPMWLFSTYLSTAFGHMLTILPYGKTILGLNFYTGLVISVIAVSAYVFFTRNLSLPKPVIFAGEFVALSLCWCPSALLYNYLTYLLLAFCVINLYLGLTGSKRRNLFIAGVCLGLNVFVRFSNLPEAAFILGVWAYGVLELIANCKDKSAVVRKRERRDFFKRTGQRSFWCIFGYAVAAGGMLLFIGLRYGLNEYVEGIRRLFSMTEEATGYSAFSMIYSIVLGYKENLRWIVFMLFFIAVSVVLVMIGKMLDAQLEMTKYPRGIFGKKFTFTGLAYFISLIISMLMIYLLSVVQIGDGQYSFFGYGDYDEYPAIIVPGIVITFIMLLWAAAVIVFTKEDIKEKLIAGLILITLLITPIGSNNGLLTSMNNLFLAAPWFAYRIAKLLRREDPYGIRLRDLKRQNKDRKLIVNLLLMVRSYLSFFPLKAIIFAVIALCIVKFVSFGYGFSFAEAKNARDAKYVITETPVFNGIRMSYDKAVNMFGLVKFLESRGLNKDRKLITYGYIPSLSFYLEMPSAFNPWMDLASYKYSVMEEHIGEYIDIARTKYAGTGNAGARLPLIITTPALAKYADGINDEEDVKEVTDRKWMLMMDLIEAGHYVIVYENDMFTVFANGR